MNNIKKIVLTGGPCAGKTTALVRIIEHFSGLGYKVFTIPEVPTMFTQAGMNYLTDNAKFFYEGEKATLQIQLALEDSMMRMAQTIDKPVIIVCDRGAMDISSYLTPELWNRIIGELGYTTANYAMSVTMPYSILFQQPMAPSSFIPRATMPSAWSVPTNKVCR